MTATGSDSPFVRFGGFGLDLRSGELTRNGRRLLLPEQPFRILALLVRSPGSLVTRDDLRRELWRQDTFVDFEHSVNAAIKRLREALGDSAAKPRFVETLPRRGYRFKAAVEAVASAAPEDAPVNAPYALLARHYDVLCGYATQINRHARAQILRAVLPGVKRVCDVGCGNGETALELARGGLEVHALDLSPVFCKAVRERARQAGLRVVVHCADMRDFTLPRPVDLVLAEFASLNNLADRRDSPRVLNAVARALADGGWFCFDVNTARSLRVEYPQTFWVENNRFKLVQHGSVETDGRRARLTFECARAGGRALAPRSRDPLARLLDRRRNQEGPAHGWLRQRAALRWFGRPPEDAGPEAQNGRLLSRTEAEAWQGRRAGPGCCRTVDDATITRTVTIRVALPAAPRGTRRHLSPASSPPGATMASNGVSYPHMSGQSSGGAGTCLGKRLRTASRSWRYTLAAALLTCGTMPLLTQTWPFPWPEDRIARYTARRATAPIVLDGRLDEADWKAAEKSPRFTDLDPRRPGIHDTRAAVLWDDANLYVGYWVEEPFVEATLTERDSLIYKNNDVELFIAGKDAYYEFEINSLGTIYEVFFIWEQAYETRRLRRAAGVRSRARGRAALRRRRVQEPSARPAHRLLELGPPRAEDRRARGRDGQRQQGPRPRLDGGAGDPVAVARASCEAGRPRAAAEGRRRLAHGFLALQPVQGSPAGEGPGRLGLEPARRVGFPRPGAVHLRSLLHRGRRAAVGTDVVSRSARSSVTSQPRLPGASHTLTGGGSFWTSFLFQKSERFSRSSRHRTGVLPCALSTTPSVRARATVAHELAVRLIETHPLVGYLVRPLARSNRGRTL